MRLLTLATTALLGFLAGQAHAATVAREEVTRNFGTRLYCTGPMFFSYALAMTVSMGDDKAIAAMEHVDGASCKRFARQQMSYKGSHILHNGDTLRVMIAEFYRRDDWSLRVR